MYYGALEAGGSVYIIAELPRNVLEEVRRALSVTNIVYGHKKRWQADIR